METLREIERVAAEFEDLPPEVTVKEDLLRRGVWFTPAALQRGHTFARKSYFIFSFDHLPLSQLDELVRNHAPEEIALEGGPRGFRRVVVSVRLNPMSPWLVDACEDGSVMLRCGTEDVAGVSFAPQPAYYGEVLPDGTPITEVAPSIEWGYLLYLTVFRMCQYFGQEEECQFCDINRNFKQQREDGRAYHAIKPIDRLLAALDRVVASGATPGAYTLTGGSVTTKLDGLDEASFYVRYAEAIEARFPGRWLGKMVVQALPRADVLRIRRSGIRIYHPNYEVWDPALFEVLCPGKARYVGRSTWMARILDAAEVFTPAGVIPNFVAGIEMAKPHGFRTEEEAWKSTAEGLDYFMRHGVMPRFTTWCPEPLSVLGRENGPASLRYHVGLLRVWRDMHARHGLLAPPGYGQAGIGNAVFSVSSFMDVIRPGTAVATLPC
ncbi:MAG: radical SAM protein [Planctomycetes bacterium]|nr:radical SAM protein [Planctomycetota bacterium]